VWLTTQVASVKVLKSKMTNRDVFKLLVMATRYLELASTLMNDFKLNVLRSIDGDHVPDDTFITLQKKKPILVIHFEIKVSLPHDVIKVNCN
jgi:hypothetical protein